MKEQERLAGSYGTDFYAYMTEASVRSARVVLPLVLAAHRVVSAVDVGCGAGAWSSVLHALGVCDVVSIDGPHIDDSMLLVPKSQFLVRDLEQPIGLSRRFDLALCLEVAEHLRPERADSFVAELCSLSDAVLFSAAVPGQGGTDHFNEQWPSYWVERFSQHGFGAPDEIRPVIWRDDKVQWYFRQNIILFLKGERTMTGPLDIRHPDAPVGGDIELTLGTIARALPHAVAGSLRHHLRRLRDR